MERKRLLFVVLVTVLMGARCGRRSTRVELPSLEIPVSCASEIRLLECDARVNPPKCKKARVKYRRGCEEIVVGRK